jgi:hypothetical protein
MERFEELKNIDNFCKVLVKTPDKSETGNNRGFRRSDERVLEDNFLFRPSDGSSRMSDNSRSEIEEPLVDIFDEDDYVRILVQCRCREQQVTFHPSLDGITVCKEECHREKDGTEKCNDVCRKLNLRTDELQLGDMLFIMAKCNNNNTLEAMIPKKK